VSGDDVLHIAAEGAARRARLEDALQTIDKILSGTEIDDELPLFLHALGMQPREQLLMLQGLRMQIGIALDRWLLICAVSAQQHTHHSHDTCHPCARHCPPQPPAL
jgi:hypothetical protein